MRHNNARHQLNRFSSWRKATLISLARSILLYQSIKTTEAKAKAARPLINQLITLAKQNTLTAKRRAFQILSDHKLVSMLFSEIGPRFANRASGFTRILHFSQRRGDNAKIVLLELTETKKKEIKKPKKDKAKEKETHTLEESALSGHVQKPESVTHTKTETATKEKPPVTKKPTKNFLGGLRGIFKKERDSL